MIHYVDPMNEASLCQDSDVVLPCLLLDPVKITQIFLSVKLEHIINTTEIRPQVQASGKTHGRTITKPRIEPFVCERSPVIGG